jgi:hypothetical protein
MAVRVRSLLTSRPIIVPLGSGSSLRLSPGQTSDEIPDVEVQNNPKIEKLKDQGVIVVESAAKPKPGQKPGQQEVAAAGDDGGSRPRSRRRSGSPN